LLSMKWPIALVVVVGSGCVDVITVGEPDQGNDTLAPFDVGPDFPLNLVDLGSDLETPEEYTPPPFCDSSASPIPQVLVEEGFVYPAPGGNTRDVSNLDGISLSAGGYSSNLLAVLGDQGRQRGISGIWLPFGSELNFRLGDYYPYDNPPEVVPEYLAVSVLVDHQRVLAEYKWNWKGRDYSVDSFFMSVPHQTTQFVAVKIPASAFPEARTYDVVVFFFKPNAGRSQLVQMFRMTLYYGGFDIPEQPCIPIAEEPKLTPQEAAYQDLTATLIPRDNISVYYNDPAESMEKDSVIEIDMDATSVQMNVLLRGTRRENYLHDHVPMKIVTFVDYVAQDETILVGLPQETRDFAHREKVEIPLNPGPETIVWMVGIYNPWIPAVSWDNHINRDIQTLYWAYTSNRLIFRRSE